jgi:endonuclease/exonuclease/phosphatase family metal-dependent hydrolase
MLPRVGEESRQFEELGDDSLEKQTTGTISGKACVLIKCDHGDDSMLHTAFCVAGVSLVAIGMIAAGIATIGGSFIFSSLLIGIGISTLVIVAAVFARIIHDKKEARCMSNNEGFVVGTWNVGKDTTDYMQNFSLEEIQEIEAKEVAKRPVGEDAIKFEPQEFVENSVLETFKRMQPVLGIKRTKLLGDTTNKISNDVDVLFMQEATLNFETNQANGDERADIDRLKKNGFDIYRPPSRRYGGRNTDLAIAIKPGKFNHIENKCCQLGNDELALITATENISGKKVAFVSLHLEGFNFNEENEETKKESAERGDDQLKEQLNYLEQYCADCDTVIIGGDMNAVPEKYKARFDLLTNRNYTMHRVGAPTSYVSRLPSDARAKVEDPERELDYMFLRQKQSKGFKAFLNRLFGRETVHIAQLANKGNLDVPIKTSGSDHWSLD